jgi:F-type H+-transporting ATPase subunit alpha
MLSGVVLSVSDGIARILGLERAKSGELVNFTNGIKGMILNLNLLMCSAVIFGDDKRVEANTSCERTFSILSIPVGVGFLGRVVDSLGNPIDGQGFILPDAQFALDVKAPGIIPRGSIREPLQTGILAIDAMIPIGRGQRELIVGDKQTGKTSIAIDTILNQKQRSGEMSVGTQVVCIYVAIGQKRSTVSQIVTLLEEKGALAYTIVVAATASDNAALQFLAPYGGCTLGE